MADGRASQGLRARRLVPSPAPPVAGALGGGGLSRARGSRCPRPLATVREDRDGDEHEDAREKLGRRKAIEPPIARSEGFEQEPDDCVPDEADHEEVAGAIPPGLPS